MVSGLPSRLFSSRSSVLASFFVFSSVSHSHRIPDRSRPVGSTSASLREYHSITACVHLPPLMRCIWRDPRRNPPPYLSEEQQAIVAPIGIKATVSHISPSTRLSPRFQISTTANNDTDRLSHHFLWEMRLLSTQDKTPPFTLNLMNILLSFFLSRICTIHPTLVLYVS